MQRLFQCLISVFSVVFLSVATFAQGQVAELKSRPVISYASQFQPVLARNGMVVSQESYASKAGLEILKNGGNAIDAAVATGFALAVTHPQAGNIGGGGFMLVYLAKEDRTVAIDFREMAPTAAHRDMFLDEKGDVDNEKSRFSMLSTGIPGSVMGMLDALEKYGTMSRADVMAPAIKLADEGFAMTWALSDSLNRYQARLKKNTAAAGYFYKADGSIYEEGELFQQKDLARTLKAIAKNGAAGFYEGDVAEKTVATMQAEGGILTLDDMTAYQAV